MAAGMAGVAPLDVDRETVAMLATAPGVGTAWVEAADRAQAVGPQKAFEQDREFAKIGGPVDRDEWFMTPQTVNAYYNPGMNEIVFPAAILQPPFFNVAADDAVNELRIQGDTQEHAIREARRALGGLGPAASSPANSTWPASARSRPDRRTRARWASCCRTPQRLRARQGA